MTDDKMTQQEAIEIQKAVIDVSALTIRLSHILHDFNEEKAISGDAVLYVFQKVCPKITGMEVTNDDIVFYAGKPICKLQKRGYQPANQWGRFLFELLETGTFGVCEHKKEIQDNG